MITQFLIFLVSEDTQFFLVDLTCASSLRIYNCVVKYVQHIWCNSLYPLSQYLSEDEGLFIVGGVQPIVHHHACAKLLPDGVRRQPVHIHFNICANFLVWQELSREYLRWKEKHHGWYILKIQISQEYLKLNFLIQWVIIEHYQKLTIIFIIVASVL